MDGLLNTWFIQIHPTKKPCMETSMNVKQDHTTMPDSSINVLRQEIIYSW